MTDNQAEKEAATQIVPPQLSEEDTARVQEYLSSPIHCVERKPFRPFMMAVLLIVVLTGISVISVLIARLNGV